MILLVFVIGSLLGAVVPTLLLLRESRRTGDLYRLLESKAAPAEVAAYLPTPRYDERQVDLIWSDDGLISAEVD